jgi:hypothetical protein
MLGVCLTDSLENKAGEIVVCQSKLPAHVVQMAIQNLLFKIRIMAVPVHGDEIHQCQFIAVQKYQTLSY